MVGGHYVLEVTKKSNRDNFIDNGYRSYFLYKVRNIVLVFYVKKVQHNKECEQTKKELERRM